MSAALALPEPRVEISLERPADALGTETLLAAAFGPGRYAKTAERVRERATFRADLSFSARVDGRVVGTVRLWSANVGGRPCVFLGPIAVDPEHRSEGLGARLVTAACAAADGLGEPGILLVGDLQFFAPLGFRVAEGVRLPGPVDPARVLVRA